jgi:hypothetical protein
VITLWLILVPGSTTSLRGLWNEALPAVIKELNDRGYTVDQENRDEAESDYGWLHEYRVEPGPATLTAAANTSEDGNVRFDLHGERFGQKGLHGSNHDEALWDGLEALGNRLSAANNVVSTTSDANFATGGPGAPGTFLPDDREDEESG